MNRNTYIALGACIVVLGAVLALYAVNTSEAPTTTTGADTQTESTFATSTAAYDIEVTEPAGTTAADEQVRAYIEAQQQDFVHNADAAYAQYMQESEPPYPWRPYALDIQYEQYVVDGFVSYVVSNYQYTGGANGIQLMHTFAFSADGSEASLADIVPEEKRAALVAAVQEQLYSLNDISASAEGVFGDAIATLMFDDFTNFFLTDSELVLTFNEYDVAPGAAGAVRVPVSRGAFSTI